MQAHKIRKYITIFVHFALLQDSVANQINKGHA